MDPAFSTDLSDLYQCDCFDWMRMRAENSAHAIVTDPPYGFIEYTSSQLEKLKNGRGGVWRIPPKLNGCTRSPLPRFTVQTPEELELMSKFFEEWATLARRVLVPGGHIMIATNPLMAEVVYQAILKAGFEKRGEIIRLVMTLRGGDRPKNGEKEFPDVTVMPRSGYEPWGLFRKPCEGTVSDNLRKWKMGGLRRIGSDLPFCDVVRASPATREERELAPHPSLKPQRLMRQLVKAALPLGQGIVLDTFAGSGSTLAAATAVGYRSIGLEKNLEYIEMAKKAIPKLARFSVDLPEINGQLVLMTGQGG